MSLQATLLAYDGKTTATLEALAVRHGDDGESVDEVIQLLDCVDGHASTGASWLLKHWLESGHTLSSEQVGAIGDRLHGLGSVWAALHVCQSVRFLEIPPSSAVAFQAFLLECVGSERPFVRAWAVDGLVRLAAHHPDAMRPAREALQAAMADDAASVRARARRLLEEL